MTIPPPTLPPQDMLRERAFIDRVSEIRDVMAGLAASTRPGD